MSFSQPPPQGSSFGGPGSLVSPFQQPPSAFPQPNGTGPTPIIPSAATTRILVLSGFSPTSLFSEFDDERGGVRRAVPRTSLIVKDDTSCFICFNDPMLAKKAFLRTICNMPQILLEPALPADAPKDAPALPPATLKPYTGDDAVGILASLQNRQRSRSIANGQHPHMRRTSQPASGMPPMNGRGRPGNGYGH